MFEFNFFVTMFNIYIFFVEGVGFYTLTVFDISTITLDICYFNDFRSVYELFVIQVG